MRRAKDIKPQQDNDKSDEPTTESTDEARKAERKTNVVKSRCC